MFPSQSQQGSRACAMPTPPVKDKEPQHAAEEDDMFADVVGLITQRRHDAAAMRMAQLQQEISELQSKMESLSVLEQHDAIKHDGGTADGADWTDEDVRWARERRALLEPTGVATPLPGGPDDTSGFEDGDIHLWAGEDAAQSSEGGTPPQTQRAPIRADASSTAWWSAVEERLQIAFAAKSMDISTTGSALMTLCQATSDLAPCPAVPEDAVMEARLTLWRHRCFA